MDELPGVLWAYKTSARRYNGISPFAITYGMEAIIPTEIGMPTIRAGMPKQENAKLVIKDLDTRSMNCESQQQSVYRPTNAAWQILTTNG